MADISLTAASIKPSTNAQTLRVNFGATITQGMAVYLDTSDNEYKIAHCETSATTANVAGIALTAGGDGQPGKIITAGNLTCDNVVAGETYILSASGKICPIGDVATNDYVTHIGIATTTTNLKLGINASGTKHA
jgi:hypothetical protein